MYKKNRQQEFCELMKTIERAGYKPADVARLLKKTPGAISQYLSGYSNPSESTLELFRDKIESLFGPPPPPEISDSQLHDQLADLRRLAPPDYEVVKTTIGLFHEKLPPELRTVNSAKMAAVKADLSGLVDKLERQGAPPGGASVSKPAAVSSGAGSPKPAPKVHPRAKAAPAPATPKS